MTRLDETQPLVVSGGNRMRNPAAARQYPAGGCGRWLLLTIMLTTSCSLVFTVALFIRALPQYAGASVTGPQPSLEQPGAERAVTIDLAGEQSLLHTTLENPWNILKSAGIALDAADRIWVNGALAKLDALPGWTVPASEIRIRRAVRLTIVDDGLESTVIAKADTLSAALDHAGVRLYANDVVRPALETALASDLTVHIKRALPIKLQVDGVLIEARTSKAHVGEALAELNAPLFGLDYALPPADAPVSENMTIEIVRVLEDIVTESAAIDYALQTRLDDGLRLGESAVLQEGRAGSHETRYRLRFENGAEVNRELIESLVAEAPVDRIVAYGTNIVQLGTVPGTDLGYWRRICVIATNYDPESQGGSHSTATGARLAKGVIAAKPHIIPYHTSVYVPGYGQGLIRDTGAGPQSTPFWIDLGYGSRAEAEAEGAHTRYTWVYHLWPPPEKITYILPPWRPSISYPGGRCSG